MPAATLTSKAHDNAPTMIFSLSTDGTLYGIVQKKKENGFLKVTIVSKMQKPILLLLKMILKKRYDLTRIYKATTMTAKQYMSAEVTSHL